MWLELPARCDTPSYRFQQVLEGVTYDLEFNWNDRGQFWTMDISDALLNPIVTGIRVVTNWGLTTGIQADGLPPGVFIAFDTGGEDKDAGVDDFGGRVMLFYRESTTVDDE